MNQGTSYRILLLGHLHVSRQHDDISEGVPDLIARDNVDIPCTALSNEMTSWHICSISI